MWTPLCTLQVPIPVDYKIEHPDPQCTTATAPFPATITVEPNSNALRVMERAVNIGPTYRFKATYFGDTLGYFIDEINGVAANNTCFWFFYIENPDGDIFRSSLGVSNFFIPGRGYSIIWRFEMFWFVHRKLAFSCRRTFSCLLNFCMYNCQWHTKRLFSFTCKQVYTILQLQCSY